MKRGRVENAAGTAWLDPVDPRLLIVAVTVIAAAAAFLLVQAQGASARAHLMSAGFTAWPGQPIWTRLEPGTSLSVANLAPAAMRARMAALGMMFSGGLWALMIHGQVEGWARRSLRIRVFFGLLIAVGLLLGLGSLVPVGPKGFMLDLKRQALIETVPVAGAARHSASLPFAHLADIAIVTRKTQHVLHYRLDAVAKAGQRRTILDCTGKPEAKRVRDAAMGFLRANDVRL